MKIHHVVPHFYPEKGGVETAVLSLAQHLVGGGHEVVVHTSRLRTAGEVLPAVAAHQGIRIRRYRPVVRLGYYTTLIRPRIDDADVVHLHGYGYLGNDWSVRHATRTGIPSAYSLHHGVARREPTVVAAGRRALYDRMIGFRSLRRATAIVAASHVDRDWLAGHHFLGARIEVLPMGLEAEAFEPGSPARARAQFGLGRFLLYLGRLHREKNPLRLLRAFASLGDRGLHLVFAGPDAGEGPRLVALTRKLEITSCVHLLGEVDETVKRDLLAACEALVLPSSYEAQGIAILEAWAQGRPAIASRVGGIPAMVEGGRDGLLFDPDDERALVDCMRQVLEHPEKAADLGRAGRAKALGPFHWETIAPKFEALYDSIRTPG
jgi:glycosyltransferase involved in cell wall biosynthesis